MYFTERLTNGLFLIRSLSSGLRGLYNADGSYRSGDLFLPFITSRSIIETVK